VDNKENRKIATCITKNKDFRNCCESISSLFEEFIGNNIRITDESQVKFMDDLLENIIYDDAGNTLFDDSELPTTPINKNSVSKSAILIQNELEKKEEKSTKQNDNVTNKAEEEVKTPVFKRPKLSHEETPKQTNDSKIIKSIKKRRTNLKRRYSK